MRNAGLDEAQDGIKISGRNINNLRYADDSHPYGRKQRSKEPLNESERGKVKSWLKLSIQETKIMAFSPITSGKIDRETMETVTDFILGGSKIIADGNCSHENKDACSFEEKL